MGRVALGVPLRVLVVEDDEDDLRLVMRQLEQAGFEPDHQCVQTAADLRQALAGGGWQIVIADWNLPAFDGMSALRIVREHDPELPFVMVSGALGEEVAVQAMRAGARDYVTKDRLSRLGPAVSRELGETAARVRTKAVETNLIRSERRLQALIGSALDIIAVLDREGQVEYISPAVQRVLGYAPEQLLGRYIGDWLHPADLQELESDAVGQLGGLVDGETVTVRCRHADHRWIWIEAIGRDLTDDPAVRGVVVNARDVTQRQADELEMARLVQAVGQTREAIVITSVDGTIEYVNPAFEQVTGYSAAEALGRNPRILKSGRHARAFYETMWSTLLAGRTWSGRLTNRRRDGSLYEEETTISPVRDKAGEISHFVAVKRDITETLALEAQLLQAQKMEAVGRLAGGMAHDFNNLLTLLINHAEFLKDSLPAAAREQADVAGILAAAERATNLTRQLLTFSRHELAQTEVVDMNRVIRNVEQLLRHSLGEDIRLHIELAATLPPIKADPGKLEQVLMNLIINARDAMPRGGDLHIGTRALPPGAQPCTQTGLPPGDYVELSVRDTGHGMSPSVATRVFEPYFTTKPRGKGTGLGLSTVFGIVSQLSGGIAVRSDVGRGAEFLVYFPVTTEPAAGQEQAREETPGKRPGGGETVLLVEDDETVRNLTVRLLQVSGFNVLSAADAGGGLQLASRYEGRIHLLLTDVVMPGMSGADLAQEFARLRPEVPVIYMSGYTADVVRLHGLPGDLPLLVKPFTATQLLRQVQLALRAARKDSADNM